MRIVSIQTIAGGTGVTTIATEKISAAVMDRKRVLAIDFGNNQMLEKMISGWHFTHLGDALSLFCRERQPHWHTMQSLPSKCLLRLPKERWAYDRCDRSALLEKFGHETLAHAQLRLQANLVSLGKHFDVCVVDLSKAHHHLMDMFIELSVELHFCERLNTGVADFADYKDRFLSRLTPLPGQTMFKQADRGNSQQCMD
ncbi:hypothetical protein PF049_04340 [Erythrobacteraceae bacterium WH01K]|nr:hypothetical protein PF049_04340 [Erythrobacteraceae bacterium WH01K]